MSAVPRCRFQLHRSASSPKTTLFRGVIFQALDFIARLAALVPKPRVNLTRFHGVFAPNSKHRALVTPARRGKGSKRPSDGDPGLDDLGTATEARLHQRWRRN